MRACKSCQHLKRPEIDRRLAAGEPVKELAEDYGLTVSSLHRHKTNCLKLASSNAIKKEAARGAAALALLPSKETLNESYAALCGRIDAIVAEAQIKGSLAIAISGLNSLRQTLDSLARLAGHIGPAQVNVAVQNNLNISVDQISERLIQQFDNEPDLKARIAQALSQIDDQEQSPQPMTSAQTSDPPARSAPEVGSADTGAMTAAAAPAVATCDQSAGQSGADATVPGGGRQVLPAIVSTIKGGAS